MYCNGYGLTKPSGKCLDGYFCPPGSKSPTPPNGLCHPGSFCPNGTEFPLPCPPRTFNPTIGASDIFACIPCSPGMYCSEENNTIPDGPCSAGFFCLGGSNSSSPEGTFGNICPTGSFCPTGSY
ncbi:hypothetical protein GUITHDRAFT_70228, partial [Guillardia theta CCMP2712]